jgi:non-specific serine/threonine protein kinase/serine/threonine-protein kinase
VLPQVPRDLAVICMKALEKRRERRYQTAVEMAADLRRYLSGESIVAQPPSVSVKVMRWGQRHPATTAGAVVGAIALAAVAYFIRERDEAVRQRLDTERQLTEQYVEIEGLFYGRKPSLTGTQIDKSVLDRLRDRYAEDGFSPRRFRDYLELGADYSELAWFEEADQWLDAALRAAQEGLDDQDDQSVVDLGLASLEMGRLRRLTGRFDDAEAFYADAERLFLSVPGSHAEILLDLAHDRTRMVREQGRLDEAERMYRELVDRAAAVGADAVRRAVLRQSLADVLLDQERCDEALAELETARSLASEASAGELVVVRIDGDLARCHDRLGRQAAGEGRFDEAALHDELAERLYRETEELMIRVKGSPDLEVAAMQANRGQFLRRRGDEEQARHLLRNALQQALLTAGSRHSTTLYVRNNLATTLFDLGDLAAAREQWEAVLAADGERPVTPGYLVALACYGLAAIDYRQARGTDEPEERLRRMRSAWDNISEALERETSHGARRVRIEGLAELIAKELGRPWPSEQP